MKEMINFCMTKHEAEIRKLAQTPLGGQRFELLIRRWEMNNEPMPVESKPDKYVLQSLLLSLVNKRHAKTCR
jgi:protein phosphatase 4 regulatory subunit 3